MGLRAKILLAFLLCFGLMGGLSLAQLRWRMDTEFAQVERADLVESMGHILKVMDASVGALASQTRDWAEWTDMYDYVRAPARHQDWLRHNLDSNALDTADLSFVDVLDAHGHVLHAVRSQGASASDWRLPVAVRTSLLQKLQDARGSAQCGLLPGFTHFALLCASRVTRSDRSGDMVGAVLMGRVLDTRRLAQWQEQTGYGLRLLGPLDMPEGVQWWNDVTPVHRLGPREMAVRMRSDTSWMYAPLTDVNGTLAAILEVDVPRELFARIQVVQRRVLAQTVISAVGIAVVLALAVHWLVVRRLRRIKDQLQTLASAAAWERRIDVRGRDELGVLASEVNLMLEMIEAQVKDLTAQSMTDTLTGLPNRRAFDMRLALEFGRARRQAQPLALLVIDVDYFKRYNDRYGHPAGDAALRTVSEVLCAACGRTIDLAARLGGEEFAVLLPATPMDGAVDVARRIRQLLAAKAVPHADSEVDAHLTLSVGIAAILPVDGSAHALVERADRALYAAKTQGRNCFQCDLPV